MVDYVVSEIFHQRKRAIFSVSAKKMEQSELKTCSGLRESVLIEAFRGSPTQLSNKAELIGVVATGSVENSCAQTNLVHCVAYRRFSEDNTAEVSGKATVQGLVTGDTGIGSANGGASRELGHSSGVDWLRPWLNCFLLNHDVTCGASGGSVVLSISLQDQE